MASSTPLVRATCCGRETEMRGDDSFDGLALGITRERARGDAAQALRSTLGEHASVFSLKSRRRASRLAERRVILLHRLHAGARRWNDCVYGSQARDLLGSGLFCRRARMASA